MQNFIPQFKNMNIQAIGGIIAAIIAAVGLIAGVTSSSTSQTGGSSTSSSPFNSDPSYVQEFRATAIELMEAEGYTVTADANRQAQASAEGYFKGDSSQYDAEKFSQDLNVVSQVWFQQATKAFKIGIEDAKNRNVPAGSRGEAGIGIKYDLPQSAVVMLTERDLG